MHLVPSSEQASTSETRAFAHSRLQTAIDRGIRAAGPVIERVLSTAPEDRIIAARNLRTVVNQDGSLVLDVGGGSQAMHEHATAQLTERLGMPRAFVAELARPDVAGSYRVQAQDNAWKRELFAHNLQTLAANSSDRYLVRSMDGQVRGVLSDRFKRLDTRPLLDSFIGACKDLGAVPYEGVSSDLRTSVRAIVPQVYEPTPGECMVFGLSWTNSDFGAGTYAVTAFALRLVCLNGMVGESSLKQVHLGARLPDDLQLSEQTYQRETSYMVSATRDIVRGVLSPAAIDRRIDEIKRAANTELAIGPALKGLAKTLGKGEIAQVKEAFEGREAVMLPPGKTVLRFSNALSWIANNAEPARRLELQEAAGRAMQAA